jgi:hypothetical protein
MLWTDFSFIHFFIYVFADFILFQYLDCFMTEVKTLFLQINNTQNEV